MGTPKITKYHTNRTETNIYAISVYGQNLVEFDRATCVDNASNRNL